MLDNVIFQVLHYEIQKLVYQQNPASSVMFRINIVCFGEEITGTKVTKLKSLPWVQVPVKMFFVPNDGRRR
jgi:hypothetical protein